MTLSMYQLQKFVALVLLILPCLSMAEIDWNEHEVKWYGYIDGMLEARKQKKNVVLVVYADWCSVCKKYSKMFYDKSVISNSDKVILVKLNQDKDERYLKKFSLDGQYVPRTYILDSEFKVQPSPFKSNKYDFFLPPNNSDYLVRLFNTLDK